MPATRRLTISGLAARLGLSKATVSKALSPHADRCDLATATRERVQAAAARLGWRPDERRAARARRRLANIGLVCQRPAPFSGGVYSDFLDSLGMALAARGRRLLFVPALDAGEWNRLLTDQHIDGAVLMEPIGPELLRTIARTRFPAVLINQESGESIPQVLSDDAGGAALAVGRLASAGHRRLAMVHSAYRQPHYSIREREAGFLAACARLGVSGEVRPLEGGPFIAAWAAEPASRRPSGVLCYNYSDTLEVIAAAEERGIEVPADLSLISGDDLGILAAMRPPVTAVQVPMAAMAERAVEVLGEIIEGRRGMAHAVLPIAASLADRGTVAPAA